MIQRVERATLHLVDQGGDRHAHAAIGPGLVVLLGIAATDTDADAKWISGKVAHLRVFEDADQKMNLGPLDLEPPGQVLVVPNFTVAGNAHKGRRPDFTGAMKPPRAGVLFERVCELVEAEGIATARGVFGGDMRVELVNDGPVTIVIESP
ncbi:MAG: D-aminoacyl-tRNA deacylase [Phycisphaerales bacterium]